MNFITLLLLGISWSLFGLRLVYAVWHGRLGAVFSKRIWIQVFLALVAFTFFGEQAEKITDQLFLGKPITLYVKSVALLGMVQLYEQTLISINVTLENYAFLRWLGFGTILFLTIIFTLYWLSPWLPLSYFRLTMIALRDTVASTFITLSFLPSVWSFWKQEHVASMKIKHIASIICCAGYLGASINNVGFWLLTLTDHQDSAQTLSQLLGSSIYIAAGSFLVMLLPQRFPRILGYPARLLVYRRLRRIENRIRLLGNIHNPDFQSVWIIMSPEQLELAIYRSLIFILDFHPLIRSSEEGEALYSAIHYIAQSLNSYPDLVNEIIKLK